MDSERTTGMTEKFDEEKFPKAEPITDKCDGCGVGYYITSFNGLIYHFEGQPECDYLFCACPECNYRTRIYVNQRTIDNARCLGIPEDNKDKYPDEGIYREWCAVVGIELPSTYELTPRHEETIRKFGDALLTIPDELFWDGIESEHGRPFPETWI
jgi:hypothetical protein